MKRLSPTQLFSEYHNAQIIPTTYPAQKFRKDSFTQRRIHFIIRSFLPIVVPKLFYNFPRYKDIQHDAIQILSCNSNADLKQQLNCLNANTTILYIDGFFSKFPSLSQDNHLSSLVLLSSQFSFTQSWPIASLEELSICLVTSAPGIGLFRSLKILHVRMTDKFVVGKKFIQQLNRLNLEELLLERRDSKSDSHMQKLPQLNIPTLKRLEIEGAYCSDLPSLKQMVKLEVLSLCDIGDDCPRQEMLPIDFTQLKSLKILLLNNVDCHVLPPSLSQLTQLTTAVFKCLNLTKFHNVSPLNNLLYLHLSGNFTLPNLKFLTRLNSLSVEACATSSAIAFPKSIKYLRNLRDLAWGTSTDTIVAHGLDQCSHLTQLFLTAKKSIVFPIQIGRIRLDYLYLQCSKIYFPSTILFWTKVYHSLTTHVNVWNSNFQTVYQTNKQRLQESLTVILTVRLLGQWYRTIKQSKKLTREKSHWASFLANNETQMVFLQYLLPIDITNHLSPRGIQQLAHRLNIVELSFSENHRICPDLYAFFTKIITGERFEEPKTMRYLFLQP